MDPREMARTLGRRGGLARAESLSTRDRRRIAAMGGQARKASLIAARRIVENLRYAEAIAELAGRTRTVRRMRTCRGRLPGLYRKD